MPTPLRLQRHALRFALALASGGCVIPLGNQTAPVVDASADGSVDGGLADGARDGEIEAAATDAAADVTISDAAGDVSVIGVAADGSITDASPGDAAGE